MGLLRIMMPPKFQLLAVMAFGVAMLFIENQIQKLEESRAKLGKTAVLSQTLVSCLPGQHDMDMIYARSILDRIAWNAHMMSKNAVRVSSSLGFETACCCCLFYNKHTTARHARHDYRVH